ncbi:hypothetical protein HJC23_002511 [Cyclotella cryptica]|uniref:EF-hand domain-containing protein n=1 Tax=Cyclotella cryptica TaxID=29204 RepID=A0ABD3QW96_9STRA
MSLPWIASALCSVALTKSTTATAFCDDNDDRDFIAKIKAKLEASTLSDFTKTDSMEALLSKLGNSAQTVFDSGIPTNFSYGFFAGYVSGLALKKIGRAASVTLGVGFLTLQALAYNGYVDVNHEKISKEVEKILDRNQDGKVDAEDLKGVIEEIRKVAEHGLGGGEGGLAVSGGGFGLGFYGGLRSG